MVWAAGEEAGAPRQLLQHVGGRHRKWAQWTQGDPRAEAARSPDVPPRSQSPGATPRTRACPAPMIPQCLPKQFTVKLAGGEGVRDTSRSSETGYEDAARRHDCTPARDRHRQGELSQGPTCSCVGTVTSPARRHPQAGDRQSPAPLTEPARGHHVLSPPTGAWTRRPQRQPLHVSLCQSFVRAGRGPDVRASFPSQPGRASCVRNGGRGPPPQTIPPFRPRGSRRLICARASPRPAQPPSRRALGAAAAAGSASRLTKRADARRHAARRRTHAPTTVRKPSTRKERLPKGARTFLSRANCARPACTSERITKSLASRPSAAASS